MKISYKGKSIETLTWVEVSEEERAQLQKEFFAKPEFASVIKQLQTLSKDGVMVDKVTRYYFRDIMAKTKLKNAKWTIEELFNSKELLGIFKARTQTNARVFDSPNLCTNIDTAIRLGGHNIAGFPPNFPIKAARNITNKYNINNNWYDFSCGWGVRLLCAMTSNINYFGTDPNYLLTERLQQLMHDYNDNIGLKSIVDIRTQGSEFFIPEWENTIGLAFSSPPYFDLEDYIIGKQSYNPQISYNEWKENYLTLTLKNINKYLIDDGILALNIKNSKTYKLADDAKIIADTCGFNLIDIELLTNNQRVTPSGLLNNAENIFIFKKKRITRITVPDMQPTIEKNIQQTIESKSDVFIETDENKKNISNNLDIYLIGVKSKKQLNSKEIYNSDNIFLGERYFATFTNNILSMISFLSNYELGKYIEMNKQNIIELLNYVIYHRDYNNSFKTVSKLCEIIDTWDNMEMNNFHLFLQIENS